MLQNSADFYKWHSELETTRTSETEEKFRRYAATLQGYLDACNELLGKVAVLIVSNMLHTRHTSAGSVLPTRLAVESSVKTASSI